MSLLLTLDSFTDWFGVSIIDFEQVNAGFAKYCHETGSRNGGSQLFYKQAVLQIFQNSQENTNLFLSHSLPMHSFSTP